MAKIVQPVAAGLIAASRQQQATPRVQGVLQTGQFGLGTPRIEGFGAAGHRQAGGALRPPRSGRAADQVERVSVSEVSRFVAGQPQGKQGRHQCVQIPGHVR